MMIEEAEKELIRVWDAKVAAGAKLQAMHPGDGITCGCALSLFTGNPKKYCEVTQAALDWDDDEAAAFLCGFDWTDLTDNPSCIANPRHVGLGDRIARRYGVR